MSITRDASNTLYYAAKATRVFADETVPEAIDAITGALGVDTKNCSTYTISVRAWPPAAGITFNVICVGMMTGKDRLATYKFWSRCRNSSFLGIGDPTFTESLNVENFERVYAAITGIIGLNPGEYIVKIERAI